MADDPTPTTPPDAAQAVQATPADESPQGETPDRAAGSKDALKADLARERDKRQALEREFETLRNGMAQAFGIQSEQATPEQMAAQAEQARREAASATRQLAIYQRATTGGANPTALLDSASFLRSVEQIDPADGTAIDQAIRAAIEANPALAAAKPPGAGWGDASQNRGTHLTSADQEALKTLGF